MKFIFLPILCFLLLQFPCPAQEKVQQAVGRNNFTAVGLQLPLGEFAETHSIGVAVLYARSGLGFARLKTIPVTRIGFTYEGGITFYAGKKEKTSLAYTYHYPSSIYLHGYGGLIYNLIKNGNIRLVAGPALGFYDGTTRFNIGAALRFCYYPAERIGICPGVSLHHEPGSAPLAAASLHVNYTF